MHRRTANYAPDADIGTIKVVHRQWLFVSDTANHKYDHILDSENIATNG
jgi:hypothetical protein